MICGGNMLEPASGKRPPKRGRKNTRQKDGTGRLKGHFSCESMPFTLNRNGLRPHPRFHSHCLSGVDTSDFTRHDPTRDAVRPGSPGSPVDRRDTAIRRTSATILGMHLSGVSSGLEDSHYPAESAILGTSFNDDPET
jgi:hypothetical protein